MITASKVAKVLKGLNISRRATVLCDVSFFCNHRNGHISIICIQKQRVPVDPLEKRLKEDVFFVKSLCTFASNS